MWSTPLILRLACVTIVLSSTANVAAYCRTKTCELGTESDGMACPASREDCLRDEHCCALDGIDLAWASPCLEIAVQMDGSPRHGIDADVLGEAVLQAFQRWQDVECPQGGTPRFQARVSGFVQCAEHQTVCRDATGNVSTVIVFDEVWEHAVGQLGVTSPVAVIGTGEIVDADLELNFTDGTYSVEPGTPGYEELTRLLSHEVGHFLGLAHSDQNDALMFYASQSARAIDDLLSEDDAAAVCAAFPPSTEPLNCPASTGPAYDECVAPTGDGLAAAEMGMDEKACIDVGRPLRANGDSSSGCAISAARQRRTEGLAPLVLLLVVAGYRPFRRRGDRPRA